MKVLLTSDWHVEEGIYTNICLDYVEYITSFSQKNEIKDIIIAGDIFEKSSKIKNEAFLPLFFKFMEMKNNGFKMYFLLGNHDIYNVDNDSLVEAFTPFGKVIKNFETIEIGGRKFDFLPYTKDDSLIPENGDILITHLSISDFYFDNRYHVNEKLSTPIEKFKDYSIVFSGHFHKQQEKENIVYIGSPYQMNFGEIGQKKGFIVFDTENNNWERIDYTQAPVYMKIKAKDFNKVNVKNAFVQVEVEEKLDNYIQLKHLLYERGALNVVPYFIDSTENKININNDNSSINFNSGIIDMMKEYLNNVVVEKIDNKKLVNLFEKIIEA